MFEEHPPLGETRLARVEMKERGVPPDSLPVGSVAGQEVGLSFPAAFLDGLISLSRS